LKAEVDELVGIALGVCVTATLPLVQPRW
jgi:hypothetical protein